MRYRLRWPLKFVYYIIPFNIAYDFISIFYTGRARSLALLRGIIILTLLVIPSIPKLKLNRITFAVISFIVYILILFPFCSDLIYSLNVSTKIFISLLMLPIGYSLFKTFESINSLNKKIFLSYILIILGLFLSNYFKLGGYTYSEGVGIQAGGFEDKWNNLTYLLLLAPLYLSLKTKRINKFFFIISFFAILVVLLISLKRIAIIGFILGYFIFYLFYGNYGKAIKNVLIIGLLLFAFLPFYFDAMKAVIEVRKERFKPNFIKSEARYLETLAIWKEIFSFKDPVKSLFGTEAFNSIGMYAEGAFGQRQAHVDYNLILISNGIVGLFLYLNIYFQIFVKYKKANLKLKQKRYRLIKGIFFALFFTSLITSLSGEMYSLTFRTIIFLYLGASLGIISNIGLPLKKQTS